MRVLTCAFDALYCRVRSWRRPIFSRVEASFRAVPDSNPDGHTGSSACTAGPARGACRRPLSVSRLKTTGSRTASIDWLRREVASQARVRTLDNLQVASDLLARSTHWNVIQYLVWSETAATEPPSVSHAVQLLLSTACITALVGNSAMTRGLLLVRAALPRALAEPNNANVAACLLGVDADHPQRMAERQYRGHDRDDTVQPVNTADEATTDVLY